MARIKKCLTETSGARACGKTTLIHLVTSLARMDDYMIAVDSSEILKDRAKVPDSLGKALVAELVKAKRGEYTRDDLTMEAWGEYFAKLENKRPDIKYILFGGSLRTPAQVPFREEYESSSAIHIFTTLEETIENVHLRDLRLQAQGEPPREDSSPAAVRYAYEHQYEKLTVPAMRMAGAVTIKRSLPLRRRLQLFIDHMAAPDALKIRLRMNLNTPDDPIHAEIAKIEAPVPMAQAA